MIDGCASSFSEPQPNIIFCILSWGRPHLQANMLRTRSNSQSTSACNQGKHAFALNQLKKAPGLRNFKPKDSSAFQLFRVLDWPFEKNFRRVWNLWKWNFGKWRPPSFRRRRDDSNDLFPGSGDPTFLVVGPFFVFNGFIAKRMNINVALEVK